jgi:hypothetical protein
MVAYIMFPVRRQHPIGMDLTRSECIAEFAELRRTGDSPARFASAILHSAHAINQSGPPHDHPLASTIERLA